MAKLTNHLYLGPHAEVVKYGLRTSLVTCLVPIYFVGASVTLYNYMRKKVMMMRAILVTWHTALTCRASLCLLTKL